MRVLIDTTYAARAPHSGTAVYINKLCEELARLPEVDMIEAVNRRRRPPAGGGLGSLRNLAGDARWAHAELPRRARRARADVIHHPLPAHARFSPVPQVVTVADLAFERLPGCFDRGFRTYAHFAHRAAARAADAVVCVSRTTASDVAELWGIGGPSVVIAPHGPGQEIPARPRRTPLHFLYVGDTEPRKNLATLLAGYALYRASTPSPLPLVLAGAATQSPPGVRLESRPTLERLIELYAGAVALVQPSLYEGFGLTALEAMGAGVPVIAARSPGLEEVCGKAALWAEAHDPKSFAHAMARMATETQLADELAARGHRRASEFSWAGCARDHLRAYSLAQASR